MINKLLFTVLLFVFTANIFSQVPNYVPTNGLVGYWPFNGNANDESLNGNNGTVDGATLSTDRNGNANSAYAFDGIDDKIVCINSGPSGNPTISINFWIKTSSNSYGHLIGYGNDGYCGKDLRIFINGNCNNSIAFDTYCSQKAEVTSFTNNWDNYHIQYDGSIGNNTTVATLYKNGILMGTECFNSNTAATNISSLIPLTFGRYHGITQTGFYQGLLDDIGIWNRILTQQEITNFYTQTAPVNCLPAYVPTSGLVGYWPFCGNANDESGNGNNGTVNGATLTIDRFGDANKAYSFDGVNDYISNPTNSLPYGNSNRTISCWFRKENNASPWSHTAVAYGANSQSNAIMLSVGNNNMITVQGWADDISTNTINNSNEWHMLTFTLIQGIGAIYYDGIQIATQNVSQWNTLQSSFYVGTRVDLLNSYFFGKIDDIGIWNRALTQQEITNLYSGTLPTPPCSVSSSDSTICSGETVLLSVSSSLTLNTSPCVSTDLPINLQSGLVGYWPFCGNANDVSGNGNNGTVNGAALTTDRFGNTNNAYSFNGNQYIDITSTNGMNSTNSISMSIWFNWSGPNSWSHQYFYQISPNPNGAITINNDGTIGVNVLNCNCPSDVGISTVINQNNWYHVVLTYDLNLGLMKMYLNGVLIGTTQESIFSYYTTNNPGDRFGCYHFNEYFFSGKLDDAGLWNKVLTQSEIQQLYTQGQNTYSWSNGATTPTISVVPTATTTYSCTVTSNGDSCTDDVTILVDTPPAPAITPSGSTSICSGNSITLSSSSATSNLWSTGEITQSIVVSTAGNYGVTVTNASGCSALSLNTTVNVNALPTVNAGIDQSVCAGISVTLSGTGSDTYSWDNAVTDGVLFTPAANATYTVTGTNTATGCTNTDQVTVTVNALPTIYAGNDQTVCAGSTATLSGTGADTYSWDNSVSNGIGFIPSVNSTYTVTGTNSVTGCTNIDQVVVTVNALPTVNAGIDQSACAGASVTLSGTGTDTYSWDNSVSNGIGFIPSANSTYTVTGTNTVTGCTNTDQVTVTVNALPTVNAGNDQTVCAGTTVALSGTGANTYSWNNNVSNGIGFIPSANSTYTVTGTNTVTGCTNTDQVDVTVNALPTVNAGIDQSVCAGASVTLSGSGTDTYSWDNSVSNGIGFIPSANTTYTVTGTNSATGCTNTDQVNVTVNALPTVNAGNDQTVCAGTTVALSGTGANTYSWNNNVSNGIGFIPSANATYSVTGTNTVTGCTNTDQVTVTVNVLPTVNAGIDQSVCAGTSVALSGTGADTYSWDNNVSNGIGFIPSANSTYTVTGTNTATGCTNTDQVVVNVNALPTVNAGNDQTICNGDNVILNGSGAASYSWDNAVIDGVSFVPTATEIYHLQGTDLNGCQGIDSVQVIVNNTSTSTLTETALDSYTLNGQTYTQSGTFSQVIANAAGCDSTITLNLTLNYTGIDEMKNFAVSIYPNPSRDLLFIHSEIELFSSFELIDNQGRIVLSDTLKGNQTSVNLEAIAPGNYYLKIEEKNTLIKVIKQ